MVLHKQFYIDSCADSPHPANEADFKMYVNIPMNI